jgi:hypothetical protein
MEDQAFLLSKTTAHTVLEGISNGIDPAPELLRPFPSLVSVHGGFRGLHSSLTALCKSLPQPKGRRDGSPEFESDGAILVHQALRDLPTNLLEDSEFWLWLTIYQCRDIVSWRHGVDASLGNFGVEARFEGLMCRMFLRAHLVYQSDADDPYELSRKGTQDFWRSFMIRRNYASVKDMARAFARHVNFQEAKNLIDDEVRQLGPKITQLNSSFAYEFMSEPQCYSFVTKESTRLFSDGSS